MNKPLIRKIFKVLVLVLFGIMSAVVGYNYAYMECAIAHQGASAPTYIALLAGIPFVILIAICLIVIRALKGKK